MSETTIFTSAIILGIACSLLFIPSIADKYSRKKVFCFSLVVSGVTQICILISNSYILTLVLLFLFGASWPGVFIVGLVYSLELFPKQAQKLYIFQFLLLNALSLLAISYYYGRISQDWYFIHIIAIVLQFVGLLFCILFVPESLWTYYNDNKFQKVR